MDTFFKWIATCPSATYLSKDNTLTRLFLEISLPLPEVFILALIYIFVRLIPIVAMSIYPNDLHEGLERGVFAVPTSG
eukprot:Nitzschia sp. Nitz4//scaffold94_size78252//29168//29497//NITZ4_005466-RA/size78252-snap-gene-0.133-mRNA-1//-1//CDS//3329560374//2903//frame0